MKQLNLNTIKEYKNFIVDVKLKINYSQTKIASTVNSALLMFYWELGEMISLKQRETAWGSKFIEQMAQDLKKSFMQHHLVQLSGGLNDKVESIHLRYFKL
jgi:hypothetical protein